MGSSLVVLKNAKSGKVILSEACKSDKEVEDAQKKLHSAKEQMSENQDLVVLKLQRV